MASILQNRQEIQEYFAEALMGDNLSGDSGGKLTSTLDLNLPPAELNAFLSRFATTLDLNLPPSELNGFFGHPSGIKVGFGDKIKTKPCVKDTKKICILGVDMSSNGEHSKTKSCVKDAKKICIFGVDMSSNGENSNLGSIFKLSSSGGSTKANESMPSSLLSWHSHMFMVRNSDGTLSGVDTQDVPSLVCMGCIYCHMYIMVSKRAPKCPNCKGDDLLDVSHFNPIKRARKN